MTFVSALSDDALADETLRSIATRSQGNAFFCEELIAAYGTAVPTGLSDLLLSRVERLGRDAQRVVRAASGAGGEVEHSVLQAVAELDDLDEALREAVQHNVLVTAERGYTFRHALLREAVYEDLLPEERFQLHARYARVVTSPASLAYHALQGHDLPTAFQGVGAGGRHGRRAARPGRSRHHVEQALRFFGAATGSGSARDIRRSAWPPAWRSRPGKPTGPSLTPDPRSRWPISTWSPGPRHAPVGDADPDGDGVGGDRRRCQRGVGAGPDRPRVRNRA